MLSDWAGAGRRLCLPLPFLSSLCSPLRPLAGGLTTTRKYAGVCRGGPPRPPVPVIGRLLRASKGDSFRGRQTLTLASKQGGNCPRGRRSRTFCGSESSDRHAGRRGSRPLPGTAGRAQRPRPYGHAGGRRDLPLPPRGRAQRPALQPRGRAQGPAPTTTRAGAEARPYKPL